MRRLFISLAAAVALIAVSIAPAGAITKTYYQDDRHPYVGLIGFYDSNWEWQHRCTAELIAPNIVLTAGHCTDNGTGGVNAHARIWFDQFAGAGYTAENGEDPITGYPNECLQVNLCAEADLMFNYGFDNFVGFPNTHDVGIVVLNKDMNLGVARLAPAGTLDALAKARGTQDTTFMASGYGISWSGKQGTVSISFRMRLYAYETLVNLNSTANDGYNLQLNGNGNDRGGTCSGDSGGPIFYPAKSNIIVGVTSWGHSNAGCRGDGYYYRTDRTEVLDWINAIVATYGH
jgi:hypothetical protein